MEAVFEMVVLSATPALTRTTKVNTEDPTAKLGLLQPIAPVPPTDGAVPHVHPAGAVIDLNVVFVGVESDNVAFVAVSGPEFVTVIVQVMFSPSFTGSGEPVLGIESSGAE